MQFQKTIGHEKQKCLFLQAIENGRLAHGYVLVGPEGIGKTTFALELAQLLGADPVLDVFVMDSEESITVEEARALHAKLALAPAGKCKAAIIKADQLTDEAANSLLKILEEPPRHSYIFLTSANYYSLLPTVTSRVQKIMFARIADEEMGQQFTPQILELARGRFGLAQRLAEDKKMLEFVQTCEGYYQTLEKGKYTERFLVSEKIAGLEAPEIRSFLNFSLVRLAAQPEKISLGKKFYLAISDLDHNVNTKLALDNLFLP